MALYQHVPADKVPPAFKELAKDWPTWDSNDADPPLVDGKVHFNYDGDYGSERVLVVHGKATITPDDGSPTVEVGEGDAVYLHKGFSCTWTIHEPLVQHYGYFGADGKEIKQTELTCDICGEDCYEESYLFNDEVDICPRCFISDSKGAEEYEGAEYQHMKLYAAVLALALTSVNAFTVTPVHVATRAPMTTERPAFAAREGPIDMALKISGSSSPHGESADKMVELKELTPQFTLLLSCIAVYEICKWVTHTI